MYAQAEVWARILEITPALEQCYRDFDQSQALPLDAQARRYEKPKPPKAERHAGCAGCPTLLQEAADGYHRPGLVGNRGDSHTVVTGMCVKCPRA